MPASPCLPQVLRVWSRILLAVPHSRLVLKNKPFACEVRAARDFPHAAAASTGVGPKSGQSCLAWHVFAAHGGQRVADRHTQAACKCMPVYVLLK